MKFSIKDVLSKRDQIRRKLRVWSHLLKKILNGKLHLLCNEINHGFGCSEKCLIYLIMCNKCFEQYVVQILNGMRQRWNNYVDNARKFERREHCMLIHLYEHFHLPRGESRTAATSKMERFVIIVNGWKPLTIITKSSILDVAAVLDPPLLPIHSGFLRDVYLSDLLTTGTLRILLNHQITGFIHLKPKYL